MARACRCTFCRKHGAVWTSHRGAELAVRIHDATLVTQYRFGTNTADCHLCVRCGTVPFITSDIDGRSYAVVNVNTFENIDPSSLPRAATDFEGEQTGARLGRRSRNWIPAVRVEINGA